jgi:hypothetical protein
MSAVALRRKRPRSMRPRQVSDSEERMDQTGLWVIQMHPVAAFLPQGGGCYDNDHSEPGLVSGSVHMENVVL